MSSSFPSPIKILEVLKNLLSNIFSMITFFKKFNIHNHKTRRNTYIVTLIVIKTKLSARSILIPITSYKFPDFFVQPFKIVVDSWKVTILLPYILWDDWPIFMISASNEQLQQQLEYTLLKPDCHSWWISKMQSGREDTLQEQYAIKFCFKLGKKCHRKVWNASDCFSTILHESSISFWVA